MPAENGGPLRVIVLGCGRVGSTLAKRLASDGHSVTVIDLTGDSFRRLGTRFKGQKVVGTGLDQDTLNKAGLKTAHAFFAVTQGDNTNIMAAQIAREVFATPRVLARVYDPIRAQAYREMGIITFCTTTIAASVMRAAALDLPEAAGWMAKLEEWDKKYVQEVG
ncbi:MAG: potassium channel family protein [Capsulimonadaceae bacterium]